MYEEEKNQMSLISNYHYSLNKFMTSSGIISILKTHEDKLKYMYNHYMKVKSVKKFPMPKYPTLSFDGLHLFCSDHRLVPTILRIKDVSFIYRQKTRNKISTLYKPIGLSYEEFEWALIKICIVGQDTFNKVYNYYF